MKMKIILSVITVEFHYLTVIASVHIVVNGTNVNVLCLMRRLEDKKGQIETKRQSQGLELKKRRNNLD